MTVSFKILFIGESGVGKTSIIKRYINNTFSDSQNTTIGIDFLKKTIEHNGREITFQIWDTAGQERFRSIVRIYYRDTDAIVLVFSLSDEKSIYSLSYWLEVVKEECGEALVILVGNKSDDEEERVISKQEVVRKGKELGLKVIECSAKSGLNVEKVFDYLADVLKEKEDENVVSIKRVKTRKRGCC